MQAFVDIALSPEDPHWTGRWWWWRSRGRTIFSCVVLVGLIAAYHLAD